ncbi:hypothetical protein [Variovorax sp. LjRoot178]|uniref:hypothetical protein n=1 Tax=Variovorax sp. LjRoot178 TaxID=3342277 RepID=UPI003ECF503E
MKSEQQFWQDVASGVNPGWTVRVDPLSAGPTPNFSRNDAFIYVVDVASGWLGAGATTTEDAAKILASSRALLADQDNVLTLGSVNTADVAGKAIALCGAAHANAVAPEVTAAVSMTVAALHETQTYARAVQANRQSGQAAMAGHWIYIAYRTKNGKGIITRPVWVSSVHPGIGQTGRFLDPDRLLAIVRSVVHGDTTSTQTTVGNAIAADGGAIVSRKLGSS